MSSYATLYPEAALTPYLRRVHIRQDNDFQWFWYHPRCQGAQPHLATHSQALGSALEHSCTSHPIRYGPHIPADPDRNPEGASWLCPHCKEYCPSDNPCDCCARDAMGGDDD